MNLLAWISFLLVGCTISTTQPVAPRPAAGAVGPGGDAAVDTAQTTRGPETFSAKALEVRGVVADATVEVGGTDIAVSMAGTKAQLDCIGIRDDYGAVVVEGLCSGGGNNSFQVNGVSVNVNLGGGTTIVTGVGSGNTVVVNGVVVTGTSAEPARVTIRVPEGTSTSFSVYGNLTVGDTLGPIAVASKGSGNARVGRVLDASLSVQGSGDIDVAEVTGSLTCSVQGSGDITVRGGEVDQLGASVMGSGDIAFGGRARDVALSVMGSGDIVVAVATGSQAVSNMGSGHANIRSNE